MPAAGQIIRALDFPPSDSAADDTTISNVSDTTPQIGSPEVSVTVIAPTSGRLRIDVGGGARDDSNDNRVFFEPLVRVGSSGGATVYDPSVTFAGFGTAPGIVAYQYGDRGSIVAGLTPGQAYWCAVTYRVSAGSTADVNSRSIVVEPAT